MPYTEGTENAPLDGAGRRHWGVKRVSNGLLYFPVADDDNHLYVHDPDVEARLVAIETLLGTRATDTVLQAVRDRLPGTLGGAGGLKVEQQGAITADTEFAAAVAAAEALANPTVPQVIAHPHLYNGASWDRQRANEAFTVLASAARTASTTSATFTNRNARALILVIGVTANPGGGETLTPIIRVPDEAGTARNLAVYTAHALNGAAGSYSCVLGLGASATGLAAGSNAVAFAASAPLPREWALHVQHSASGSWTYSVRGYYIV